TAFIPRTVGRNPPALPGDGRRGQCGLARAGTGGPVAPVGAGRTGDGPDLLRAGGARPGAAHPARSRSLYARRLGGGAAAAGRGEHLRGSAIRESVPGRAARSADGGESAAGGGGDAGGVVAGAGTCSAGAVGNGFGAAMLTASGVGQRDDRPPSFAYSFSI